MVGCHVLLLLDRVFAHSTVRCILYRHCLGSVLLYKLMLVTCVQNYACQNTLSTSQKIHATEESHMGP